MKETKQVPAQPFGSGAEARAVLHDMLAAFEAFKGANDARLNAAVTQAVGERGLEVFRPTTTGTIEPSVGAAQRRWW